VFPDLSPVPSFISSKAKTASKVSAKVFSEQLCVCVGVGD
jgi:hypothetical protein